MGFLLVHHELLRAKARVNELTLDQTKFKRKQERIQKAIQKKEEFYNKKSTALKNSFSQMKSQLTNALNMGNFAALGSVLNIPGNLTNASASIFAGLSSGAVSVPGYDPETGEWDKKDESQKINGKDKLNENEMHAAMLQQQYATQMQVQQLKATYQAMMDQYLQALQEAQEQAMEDEKDAALLPLKDEDSDMEIKISTNELQLTEAKEYAQALKEEESQRVKDSVPKFGLG